MEKYPQKDNTSEDLQLKKDRILYLDNQLKEITQRKEGRTNEIATIEEQIKSIEKRRRMMEEMREQKKNEDENLNIAITPQKDNANNNAQEKINETEKEPSRKNLLELGYSKDDILGMSKSEIIKLQKEQTTKDVWVETKKNKDDKNTTEEEISIDTKSETEIDNSKEGELIIKNNENINTEEQSKETPENITEIVEQDLKETDFKEKELVRKATVDESRIVSDKQAEKIKSNLGVKLKSVIDKIRTKVKYFIYGSIITGGIIQGPGLANMLTYKLTKEGLLKAKEIEVVEEEYNRKKTKDIANTFFQIISVVPDKNDFYTNSENADSLFSYRSQWNNEDGFIYIATPNKKGRGGNAISPGRNITYDNVIGVAHFLIDTDIRGNNSTIGLNHTKEGQYVPVFTLLESSDDGDKVRLNYIKKENLPENNDSYLIPTPLLQWKVSDIDWNSEVSAQGFKVAKEVVTKTGENTGIIFKNKNTLGRFSGNSVVFIFQDCLNNTIVRDLTGSFNQIINEIEHIKNEFNISDDQITIGRYDSGSFSAKPKANKGKLETNRWNNYNPSDGGTALIIPEDQEGGEDYISYK